MSVVFQGTPIGKQVDQIMKDGKLVPDSIVLGLVKLTMAKSGATKFLFDGFPRTLEQSRLFEKEIGNVNFVLHLDVRNTLETSEDDKTTLGTRKLTKLHSKRVKFSGFRKSLN